MTKFVNNATIITADWLNAVDTKLSNMISIKDFGAVGDGVADDTAAATAFLSYLKANGGKGTIPRGTYNISYIDIDLTGNKPFEIWGDGVGKTILHCTAPTYNFLTFTGCSKVALRHMTLDGGYVNGQSTASNGSAHVFKNAWDCVVDHVSVVNVVRIAFLAYNDHQTDTTKVYNNLVYDYCYVDGLAAYVEGTGPSAFIVADYNNSRITNSTIKNIGLYGYEFKNDSSNCLILNCSAENVFNPIYFGGDGAHTELGYVKHSLVDDILIYGGTNPIFLDHASYNTVRNIRINNTGRVGQNYTVGIRNTSNYNTVSGIEVTGRDTAFLCDLRVTAHNNLVEFSNIIDVGSTKPGAQFDNTCAGNRIVFGPRDSTHNLIPTTVYSNTVVDLSLNTEQLNISAATYKKIKLGDVGNDSLFTTFKGFAVLGDTCDVAWQTKQDYQFQYVGNFAKQDVFSTRFQLSTGERRDYTTVAGIMTYYATSPTAFYPGGDMTQSLGTFGNRFKNAHVQSLFMYPITSNIPSSNGQLTIDTPSNTQVRLNLRGSDGVVRSTILTLT